MNENKTKYEELKSRFKLDEFQIKAIKYINENKNIVVCAPTGAGKTVIAEHAIIRTLKENKRIFYTTPLKALSNQKFRDFSFLYGEEKVGLLTGDTSINKEAQIIIMTTEVFRNMLYGTNFGRIEESLKNVQYIILDEVHYMNDEQRGTVWEESIIYCPTNIQIIALSATIANAAELTEWIDNVHGKTELINTDFRPVPLKHFYFSPSSPNQLLTLFSEEKELNPQIKPEKSYLQYIKNKKNDATVNLIKILHQKDMLPSIYFTFSRKKCDENLTKCANLKLLNKTEEKKLEQTINEYITDNPYLNKHKHLEYLYCGVASHHAGLLPVWKILVEKLFQQGLIKVVFATETLAAGINMPARSTVISSISKRSDEGHRILTANEFLQMSGRAGRRGIDEIGYVITIGTSYQSPNEVSKLASSLANPLESRFTPTYSMVLNLLQKFDLEKTRELIFKSFGYFTSSERLKPLYQEQKDLKNEIERINSFQCFYSLSNEDIIKYNKLKNTYIQYKKIANILKKQAEKKQTPEILEYENKVKKLQKKVEKSKCHKCKQYKKHIRDIDILGRFYSRYQKVNKIIEYKKDIYWKQFINLVKVLEEMNYLSENYPTSKGFIAASIRSENEIFFSELIINKILDNLSPSELAAVLCAVVSEEPKKDFSKRLDISKNIENTFQKSYEIMKKLRKIQKKYNVVTLISLNTHFSPLIEIWTQGEEWEELIKNLNIEEGDIVRTFKRTIDLLRQLTVIPNIPEKLAKTASIAIESINRIPVMEDF
ncbi:MAG: DEAD/DEAH box helicase [bacterium]